MGKLEIGLALGLAALPSCSKIEEIQESRKQIDMIQADSRYAYVSEHFISHAVDNCPINQEGFPMPGSKEDSKVKCLDLGPNPDGTVDVIDFGKVDPLEYPDIQIQLCMNQLGEYFRGSACEALSADDSCNKSPE